MPNKTFWIPQGDLPMWAAAARVARKRKTSVYRVVTAALANELPRADAEQPSVDWSLIAADAA